MIYVFRCPGCGRKDEVPRLVDQRDDPLNCYCGTPMDRIIAPSRFAMHHWAEDFDIAPVDSIDSKRLREQHAAEYERGWGGKTPSKQENVPSMGEIMQKAKVHGF